jgi:hypothetical protein
MIEPRLLSGVEEASELACFRIVRADVARFAAVAWQARKSKILERCFAAVLFGDDVVDLMARGRIVLVNQAILATIRRAQGNLSAS